MKRGTRNLWTFHSSWQNQAAHYSNVTIHDVQLDKQTIK